MIPGSKVNLVALDFEESISLSRRSGVPQAIQNHLDHFYYIGLGHTYEVHWKLRPFLRGPACPA